MSTTTTTTATAPAEVLRHNPTPTATVSGDISSELLFYSPPEDGSAPYYYVEAPPPGIPASNILTTDNRNVTLHDLRGLESQFSLDKQAFQPIQGVPSAESEFTDEDRIKSVYYPEIESLVKAHIPGASQVVIFDHTIRRSNPGAHRAPVLRVHIDQTHESGYERVRLHLPEDRAKEVIEKGIRARIVNVWRPLNGPVEDHPLGFADSTTVRDEDVVSVKHIYPFREGATSAVKWNEGQKWWYWSGQKNDEVVLIKCFDTDTTVGGGAPGRKGRVPHTAFVHPKTPEGARGRESIEVRCLVIG